MRVTHPNLIPARLQNVIKALRVVKGEGARGGGGANNIIWNAVKFYIPCCLFWSPSYSVEWNFSEVQKFGAGP